MDRLIEFRPSLPKQRCQHPVQLDETKVSTCRSHFLVGVLVNRMCAGNILYPHINMAGELTIWSVNKPSLYTTWETAKRENMFACHFNQLDGMQLPSLTVVQITLTPQDSVLGSSNDDVTFVVQDARNEQLCTFRFFVHEEGCLYYESPSIYQETRHDYLAKQRTKLKRITEPTDFGVVSFLYYYAGRQDGVRRMQVPVPYRFFETISPLASRASRLTCTRECRGEACGPPGIVTHRLSSASGECVTPDLTQPQLISTSDFRFRMPRSHRLNSWLMSLSDIRQFSMHTLRPKENYEMLIADHRNEIRIPAKYITYDYFYPKFAADRDEQQYIVHTGGEGNTFMRGIIVSENAFKQRHYWNGLVSSFLQFLMNPTEMIETWRVQHVEAAPDLVVSTSVIDHVNQVIPRLFNSFTTDYRVATRFITHGLLENPWNPFTGDYLACTLRFKNGVDVSGINSNRLMSDMNIFSMLGHGFPGAGREIKQWLAESEMTFAPFIPGTLLEKDCFRFNFSELSAWKAANRLPDSNLCSFTSFMSDDIIVSAPSAASSTEPNCIHSLR